MWPCLMIKCPDEPLACLGCLATDVKLHNINENGLASFYTQLVSEPMDTQRQYFCSFCQTLLLKFFKFKARCQKAAQLLRHSELQGSSLTTEFIKNLTLTLQWSEYKPPYIITQVETVNYIHKQENMGFFEKDSLEKENVTEAAVDEDIRVKIEVHDGEVDSEISDEKEDSRSKVEPVITSKQEHTRIGVQKVKNESLKRKRKTQSDSDTDIEDIKSKTRPIRKRKTLADEKKLKELKRKVVKKVNKKKIEDKDVKRKEKSKIKESNLPVKGKEKRSEKKETKTYEDIVKEYAEKVNFEVIFLTIEQQKQEIIEKIQENQIKGKKCLDCGKNFLNILTYERHVKTYHDSAIGNLKCELCNTYFNKKRRHISHTRIHATMFSCKTCGFKTKVKDTLKQHFDWHNGKSHECQYCKMTFGKMSSYFTHIRLKHSTELNWCELCGESFIGEQGIKSHKQFVHKDIVIEYKCKKCKNSFLSVDALKKHELLNKCDLFACVRCGDSFITEKLLKYHVLQHNNDKNIECESCKVQFLNMAALNKHEVVCGDGNPCVQCGNSYETDELLKKHVVEQHSLGEEFPCEYCHKVLPSVSFLRQHVARVHVNRYAGAGKLHRSTRNMPKHFRRVTKQYRRDETMRRWVVKEQQGRRMVIKKEGNETEPCTVMCEVCGKGFKDKYRLQYHQRLHNSAGHHRCPTCDKRFINEHVFLDHLRVHTGERPFLCGTCAKSFKTRAGLYRHEMIHTNSRRHVCELCAKSFRTSSEVKLHISSVHLKMRIHRERRGRKKENI